MNKGWQTQIKKLEKGLMKVGAKPGDFQPMKKLLDEKEKDYLIFEKEA